MGKQWVCPTCGTGVESQYCPACGSRLLHSLRDLTIRPGAITNAYVLGPRKPYIGPFQLFLIVNVAFFAVQAFADSPIFSNSLYSPLFVIFIVTLYYT